MNPEIEYLFERACQEVQNAQRAIHPKAMAVHTDLSIRYLSRARSLMPDDPDPA